MDERNPRLTTGSSTGGEIFCSWLVTNGSICLSKPVECKACPGIVMQGMPGHNICLSRENIHSGPRKSFWSPLLLSESCAPFALRSGFAWALFVLPGVLFVSCPSFGVLCSTWTPLWLRQHKTFASESHASSKAQAWRCHSRCFVPSSFLVFNALASLKISLGLSMRGFYFVITFRTYTFFD